MPNPAPNFMMNHINAPNDFSMPPTRTVADELPRPPIINRREIHYLYLFCLSNLGFPQSKRWFFWSLL